MNINIIYTINYLVVLFIHYGGKSGRKALRMEGKCYFCRLIEKQMKKTGLYFGSFNPIHVGHLIIAEYLVEHSDLQELWFVVSPQNPLKKKASLLDDRERLHIVNLAIEDDLRFKACDIEFSLPKPSYTSYTLQVLRE